MMIPARLFFQCFAKPFYKENAGALVFVYTMMFCIVSLMDGAGMFAYHYSLVTSMLSSSVVFFLVFLIWFLYARKCAAFVANIIHSPQHSFLYIINCLGKKQRFLLFLFVNAWLLLPILSYSLFIVYVGCLQHFYLPVLIVVGYLFVFMCLLFAMAYLRVTKFVQTASLFLAKNNPQL